MTRPRCTWSATTSTPTTRGRPARRPRPVTSAPGPSRPGVTHDRGPGTRPARRGRSRRVPPHAHQPGALLALLDPAGAALHAVAVVPRSQLGGGRAGADQRRDARALREGCLPRLRQGAGAGLRRPAQRSPAHRAVPPAVPRGRERGAGDQPRPDHRHRPGARRAAVRPDGARAQLRRARAADHPRGDRGPLQRAGVAHGDHPPGVQRPGAAGAPVRHPDLPDGAPDGQPAPVQARPRAGTGQQHRDAPRARRAHVGRWAAARHGRQRQPGPDAAEADAEGTCRVAPAARRRPR